MDKEAWPLFRAAWLKAAQASTAFEGSTEFITADKSFPSEKRAQQAATLTGCMLSGIRFEEKFGTSTAGFGVDAKISQLLSRADIQNVCISFVSPETLGKAVGYGPLLKDSTPPKAGDSLLCIHINAEVDAPGDESVGVRVSRIKRSLLA